MSEFKMDPISTVVAAHISQHPALMSMTELHDLIVAVRRAFEADTALPEPVTEAAPEPAPIVKKTLREIKASIKADGLVSFEDGRVYKTLKRHLTRRGLTPEQYREKHGLHEDYPMVAPEYSRKRSELAKRMGLGTQR